MTAFLRRLRGLRSSQPVPLPKKASSEEELRVRVGELGTWMYRFELGFGVQTKLHDEYLEGIHQTRWSMIEPELRRAFTGRWEAVRALDVACNEGWFSFKLAGLGAREVVGFDARDISIRKAQFVQAQLGTENVSFRVDNLFARPGSSVTIDRGPGDGLLTTDDVLVVMGEPEFQWNPLSSVTGISLVPSLSALLTMLKHAGFRDVTQAQPSPDAVDRYKAFDRVILFGRV